MKVEQQKIDTAGLAPIREFELKGHLAGKDSATASTTADEKGDSINLAQSDFQLYQALKILKTMSMVEKGQNMAPVQINTTAKTASN